MHKTTYTNYEQGKREPPFELMIRLAEFYNVSLDYIAGLTNTPRPLYPTAPPGAGRGCKSPFHADD